MRGTATDSARSRVPCVSASCVRLEAGGGAGGPGGRGRRAPDRSTTDELPRRRDRRRGARGRPRRPRTATIRTPAFMPVGTKATVKSLHPDEVRALGAEVDPRQHVPPALPARRAPRSRSSAASTRSRGGTARSSPTPADSRSSRCATRFAALDDDGVTFRSVYDGADARFTPEGVAEIQRQPRLRHRDVPRRLPAGGRSTARARAGRRSSRRAGPSARSTRRARRASSGSASRRAVPTGELRTRSIDEITALPFDGFALGGPRRRRGEGGDARLRRVGCAAAAGRAAALLHGNRRPGGDPRGRSRGGSTCSTACCRRGRRARARRSPGRGGSTSATLASATIRGRSTTSATCPACERFSRAYVRHLVTQRRDARAAAAQPA